MRDETCWMEKLEIGKEAELFLRLIGDLAVGGPHVTPAAPSFSNLRTKRFALQTLEDWTQNEAIHINASWKSMKSAYQSLGRYDNPTKFEDRVFTMDFDVFTKDGEAKDQMVTPKEVLNRLRAEGRPLPYCYSYSGTPGNFHMIWVLRLPIPRGGTIARWRRIYRHWGADEGFTNSTMRNPIFRSFHPNRSGQSTHWWTEWSDAPPLLYSPEELVPSEVLTRVEQDTPKKQTRYHKDSENTGNQSPSPSAKYQDGMTESELLEVMGKAEDGSGRWQMLRSWTVRKMYKYHKETGRYLTRNQMKELVEEGNRILKEPMDDRRLRTIYHYWDRNRQKSYIQWKKNAGASARSEAARRYFALVELEALLVREMEGRSLPKNLRVLSTQFTGRKWHGSKPSVRYLAWMSQMVDKERIDEETGEVHTVPAYDQVRNILREGRRKNYTKNDILDISKKVDIRDTALYKLTRIPSSARVEESTITYEGKNSAIFEQGSTRN